MPSPYKNAAPKTPRRTKEFFTFFGIGFLWLELIREAKAKMPPSPLSSARKTKMRYLTEITIMSDQKTRDKIPKMLSGVGGK